MISSRWSVCFRSSLFTIRKRNTSNFTTDRSQEDIDKLLKRYVGYKQVPVSMRQLLEIGASDQIESYKFLRAQIPIRLSHAILELDSIPGTLLKQPSIREISKKYLQSFLDLLDLPTVNEVTKISHQQKVKVLDEFSIRLNAILCRHANVVPTMGMGILELKQSGIKEEELIYLKEFLDRFYMSRIGMRTHMEQYLSTYASSSVRDDKWVGIFCMHCDIREIVEKAVDYSAELCKLNYSDAPPVEINVTLGDDPTIMYCPSHLNYILTELLKNSMRAVVEFHGEDKLEYPPIVVNVYEHKRELVIKISDLGGGISQQDHPMLFSYCYTTANSPDLDQLRSDESHFAGFGYGLALARLHARYFGGELVVCPMYGHGTDVFIYIKNADHAREILPNLDRSVIKRYQTSDYIPNLQNWMESERLNTRKFPENALT